MYPTWTKEFGEAWGALLWKSTPWVHWLVVHSAHLLMEHRSIRMFSSIPTEYRHRAFKLDIQHSYLGNKKGLFISDTLLVSSNHFLLTLLCTEGQVSLVSWYY